MNSYSNNFAVLGKQAHIEINDRCNHVYITLDGLVVTDASGDIGFWQSFNETRGSFAKGAAYKASLDKFAKEWIESEIVEYIRFAQEQIKVQS